jgi:hypothetical protein
MTLKARVKAGRLVMDEPTNLPEGTEIELLPLDPGALFQFARLQAAGDRWRTPLLSASTSHATRPARSLKF